MRVWDATLNNKIWIIGPPGSGKTTLAKKLGNSLDLDVYHLDDIYWDKNWVLKTDILKTEFEDTLKKGNWVVDGFYEDSASQLYKQSAYTFVIRVGYLKMMYRLFKRSLKRLITREKVCGDNRENIGFLLSKDGLFNYAHKQYIQFKFIEQEYEKAIIVDDLNQIIKIIRKGKTDYKNDNVRRIN